jgi:antitoxin (DNA-binding transcriptional repressor) of toxin-antitoxin stability system
MRVTASKLRENVYRILDQVLETGVPVEIERRGRVLKLVPVERPSKLEGLPPRPYLSTEPEDLVHVDWSGEWRP